MMAWRRRPDSEQCCGHARYRVLARWGDSECHICLRCRHKWWVHGKTTPARVHVAMCGAPWRAA
jgi:hypothetical protein